MAPVRTNDSPESTPAPALAPIVKNVSAPGVEEYYPVNDPLIGTPLSKVSLHSLHLFFSTHLLRFRTSTPRTSLSPSCSNLSPFETRRSRIGYGSYVHSSRQLFVDPNTNWIFWLVVPNVPILCYRRTHDRLAPRPPRRKPSSSFPLILN